MRFKFVTATLAAALSVSLLGATSASAATEFGNGCVGNKTAGGFTPIAMASGPGNPLPATILTSGVVTRWRLSIVPIGPEINFTETLKIFRPVGPGQFQVIGESAPIFVASGTNTYPTRIPVKAGDHIGGTVAAGGETGGLYCETGNPGDRLGFISGNPTNGSTGTVSLEEAALQLPIVVSVEPDADNDGFGDETQDQCPQSPTTQGACPPVVLSTSKQVRKGSVTIIVTSSTAAPVTVKGVAKLGKGKKAKLNGGTQSLVPGVLGKFRLFFTKGLKKKLKELPPKRSVKLNVTVSGTSVSGAVSTKTLKLKLKGQAKP
jgi:hypothetical protein